MMIEMIFHNSDSGEKYDFEFMKIEVEQEGLKAKSGEIVVNFGWTRYSKSRVEMGGW